MMVATFDEFKTRWDGTQNFLMGGECTPFAFSLPPLSDVIETLRRDDATRFLVSSDDVNQHSREPAPTAWYEMPVDELLEQPFSIGHFGIEKWDVPGGFLEGFGESVVKPLRDAFESQGFAFSDWFKPYVFASGPNCCSTYHMDFSHVLAWQKYGVKHFCSLEDPDKFAPASLRRAYMSLAQADRPSRPEALTADDIVDNVMSEGSVLWNAFLTPHWVCGDDQASLSINISFRGLTLDGQLCPREAEVSRWREQTEAPAS